MRYVLHKTVPLVTVYVELMYSYLIGFIMTFAKQKNHYNSAMEWKRKAISCFRIRPVVPPCSGDESYGRSSLTSRDVTALDTAR